MFSKTQPLKQTPKQYGLNSTSHLNPLVKQRKPVLTGSNQITQNFSFRLKNLVNQSDPSIAWQYNIPVLNVNQKQLFLATQSFATILQGYIGNQWPQTISIGIDGYSGFIGFDGTPTNKIIILNLNQVNTYSQNGVIYRDLLYKNDSSTMWSLGSQRNIAFKVYVDQQTVPVKFPIQNSLALNFKIMHLSM